MTMKAIERRESQRRAAGCMGNCWPGTCKCHSRRCACKRAGTGARPYVGLLGYLMSLAVSSMGVAERAWETGQPVLVLLAMSWKVDSSMLGTWASALSWILVILKPSPTLSMETL